MSGPRDGNWMQTCTGRAYWPCDPRSEDVFIEDIAGSLSRVCRFGGHLKDEFDLYSVAEHSVHVSNLVPREHAFAALMHDAAEAYLGDVVRPFKVRLLDYRRYEDVNWLVIAARFGLPFQLPQCVHDADMAMLFAEQTVLLHKPPLPGWGMGIMTPIVADPAVIEPLSRRRAKWRFMERFEELTGARLNEEAA